MARMQKGKVVILGAGALGTALGQVLARAGRTADIVLIEHFLDVVEAINGRRENPRFLPGVVLSPRLRAAAHRSAAGGATLVILAVPTSHAGAVLADASPELEPGVPILVGTKGFWGNPPQRGDVAAAAAAPGHPILILGGGALAPELAAGRATRLVIGGPVSAAEETAALLRGPGVQVAITPDAIGVALGGALKNVYTLGMAVAEGICEGGDNWRGTFITDAAAEMGRIAAAFGADAETLRGPAGLGDLITTSLSPLSRNRKLGALLGQKNSLETAIEYLGHRPEGLDALEWLAARPEADGAVAPLLHAIRTALHGDGGPLRVHFGLAAAA
jgi:glycerol-3-phosphate dehydrogenase (NAD(P)+)